MHAMHAPALRGASLASSLKASAPRARVSRPVRSTIRADAQVIDGKAIAADVREEVRLAVAAMKEKHGGKVPGLAVVLVGRPQRQRDVRAKQEEGVRGGWDPVLRDGPPRGRDRGRGARRRAGVQRRPDVHGILVQLPMPDHIDEERVLGAIDYEKDVDGFHPLNIGRLSQRGREPLFVPCTPRGCIELLERTGVAIAGKEAVVVGRSNVVGTPAALLLQRRDATVTIVHSKTPNSEEIVRRADIVIAACGRMEMVKGSWIKPGAAVIDVGINAKDDPSKKRGYRLVGDADYEECSKVAGYITPVPGGVGPMTIAILLQNTLEGATRAYGLK